MFGVLPSFRDCHMRISKAERQERWTRPSCVPGRSYSYSIHHHHSVSPIYLPSVVTSQPSITHYSDRTSSSIQRIQIVSATMISQATGMLGEGTISSTAEFHSIGC